MTGFWGWATFFSDILPSQSFAPPLVIAAVQRLVARASVLRNNRLHTEEIAMSVLEPRRRSFLFGLGSLGISQVSAQGMTGAQASAPEGYVLGATEEEQLVHFRDHSKISIKVSAATGSDNLAQGTQQVTVGAGIPVHRHSRMD
jgi:hypothetical protein